METYIILVHVEWPGSRLERKVFISYSSKNKQFVDRLLDELEEMNISCWVAPRDIPPGDDYGETIITAIKGCELILLVFSEGSNTSPQVKREIDRGVSLGKDIVAVRIDDIKPTGAMEYYLSPVHWFDCCGGIDDERISHLPGLVKDRLDIRRTMIEETSFGLGSEMALIAAYGEDARPRLVDDERTIGMLGLEGISFELACPSNEPSERESQLLIDHGTMTSSKNKLDREWFELGLCFTAIALIASNDNDDTTDNEISSLTSVLSDLIDRTDLAGASGSNDLKVLLDPGPPYDREEIYDSITKIHKAIGGYI